MASIARRIRTVSKTDRDQWLQLWQGYLEFYQSELDQTLTDLLWQRILDPNHHIQARVAVREDDGSLLGLAHFFPHAHTWYDHDVCYLNDLFVSPQIRGSGIGQDLIDAVVDESRRRGWAELYWQTQNDNAVARGLYDKVTGGADGFVSYCIDLSK